MYDNDACGRGCGGVADRTTTHDLCSAVRYGKITHQTRARALSEELDGNGRYTRACKPVSIVMGRQTKAPS